LYWLQQQVLTSKLRSRCFRINDSFPYVESKRTCFSQNPITQFDYQLCWFQRLLFLIQVTYFSYNQNFWNYGLPGIREEKIFERMRIDDVHFEDYQSMK